MLYEVVIVKNPTKKEKEDGKLETVLTDGVVLISASSEAVAAQLAMRKHGQSIADEDLDRIDVKVRSFG